MGRLHSLYAKKALESCEKIIKAWDDNPILLHGIKANEVVFQTILEVSLLSLRDGLDPRLFLSFFEGVFKSYYDTQVKLSHSFKRFYFHIFIYSLIFQYSLSRFFKDDPFWLVAMLLLLNILLYFLAPRTRVFMKVDVLSGISICSLSRDKYPDSFDNSSLLLSRLVVEEDLKKYKRQAQSLEGYFSILELFFCAPLLFIFCSYFLLTRADFSAF